MARNKTQPKIEKFLNDLTQICRKHDMIVDANGGGYQGGGKERHARFGDGCPLVLLTKSGKSYRKVGYLWYSFLGDDENITFNFEPQKGSPYTEITFDEDPFPTSSEDEQNPTQAAEKLQTSIQKSSQVVPDTLAKAMEKARQWNKDQNYNATD